MNRIKEQSDEKLEGYPIHFRAVYNPAAQRFYVELTALGHKHVQSMSEKEYDEMCANIHSEIKIAGWKLRFSPGSSRKVIRTIQDYFLQVQSSFKEARARGDI